MPRNAKDETIRFTSTIEANKSGYLVTLSKSAVKALSSETKIMVEGTMHGFPFRAVIESNALRISESLRKAMNAKPNDEVTVEITRIGEEAEVRVPVDFQQALAASPKAKALWDDVTPMARREWVRWIASAKQGETRVRRIEVGIDKLLHGMRRPCCFPGLNFVTKGLVEPEETWVALPSVEKQRSAPKQPAKPKAAAKLR